jgi:hypothetical protein
MESDSHWSSSDTTITLKLLSYHVVYAIFSARHAESQNPPYGTHVEGMSQIANPLGLQQLAA